MFSDMAVLDPQRVRDLGGAAPSASDQGQENALAQL